MDLGTALCASGLLSERPSSCQGCLGLQLGLRLPDAGESVLSPLQLRRKVLFPLPISELGILGGVYFLAHSLVAHRLVLAGVALHLRAVQGHVPQLHHPRLLAQSQNLHDQLLKHGEVALAEAVDRCEVRMLSTRQHTEWDALVR